MKIGVIGSNGFVGKQILNILLQHNDIETIPIIRSNFHVEKTNQFDVIINAAMPSKRFAASNNPFVDFRDTVEKTAEIYYRFKFNKFVQISTLSARAQLNTVYGRHKKAAEDILDINKDLVIRLGPLFGEGLQKGVLMDMLYGRKVFVNEESRYCFADVVKMSELIINKILNFETGIIELGAKTGIKLKEIAHYLNKPIIFSGSLDNQEVKYHGDINELPDVDQVFKFLTKKQNEFFQN